MGQHGPWMQDLPLSSAHRRELNGTLQENRNEHPPKAIM